MRQTTHAGGRKQTAPQAGPDPYAYDLPLMQQMQPAPAPAPQPAPTNPLQSWLTGAASFGLLLLFIFRDDVGRWWFVYSYAAIYAFSTIVSYWQGERPKQSFLSWTLRVVGIWLNLYVGLVTVPASLRGSVPDWLAFGLPAFVMTLVYQRALPLKPSDKTYTLRQQLLYAAWLAAVWAWAGPVFLK